MVNNELTTALVAIRADIVDLEKAFMERTDDHRFEEIGRLYTQRVVPDEWKHLLVFTGYELAKDSVYSGA